MTTFRGKLSERRVVDVQNLDRTDDNHLLCCWDDCEKYGTELHKAREFLGVDPRHGGPIFTWYVFCSERHKMFWVNAPRGLYKLPAGYRLSAI